MSRPYWGEPDYVADGDTVWLPKTLPDASGRYTAWRCVVVCAMGDSARIVVKASGVERIVRLASLVVPPDDVRHPNQRCAREQAIFVALNS